MTQFGRLKLLARTHFRKRLPSRNVCGKVTSKDIKLVVTFGNSELEITSRFLRRAITNLIVNADEKDNLITHVNENREKRGVKLADRFIAQHNVTKQENVKVDWIY